MPWFGGGKSPYETARAMIGAKAGDCVLVLGAGDAGLAADTALVTGLNGSTVVADPSPDMAARIDAAAARAGALVETSVSPFATLAFDAGRFDIIVVQIGLGSQPEHGVAVLSESARVVRPGGRVLVIERTRKPGLAGAFGAPAGTPIDGAAVQDALGRAGLRAARVLAETGGQMFVEAIKPRGSP